MFLREHLIVTRRAPFLSSRLFTTEGTINMVKPIKPGTPAPISGQYRPAGPRGGFIGSNEITAIQGKPLPPTDKPGQGYLPVDPTKHKR